MLEAGKPEVAVVVEGDPGHADLLEAKRVPRGFMGYRVLAGRRLASIPAARALRVLSGNRTPAGAGCQRLGVKIPRVVSKKMR